MAAIVSWARSAGAARLAAVAATVLAVAVLVAVAWLALRPGADAPPIELSLPRADTPPTDAAPGGGGGPGGAVAADPIPGAAGRPVVVHVAGAVAAPGLYRLGGEPRVADALDAAGGPAADADLDAVNLAGRLTDGERIYLPRRGEVPPAVVAGGGGAGGSAGGGAVSGPIDLNTATVEQLDGLPGVGPATAEAILSYRKEKGRFRSVDELLEVRGIGESKLASLRSKVRV